MKLKDVLDCFLAVLPLFSSLALLDGGLESGSTVFGLGHCSVTDGVTCTGITEHPYSTLQSLWLWAVVTEHAGIVTDIKFALGVV